MSYKSGFVTIIGRPNVGKSTLMNSIIGEKISIISDKPQTTRNQIKCIYTKEGCQIVFLDTPGMQKPRNKLGEYMEHETFSALKDVDAVLWLVDNSLNMGTGDKVILEKMKNIKVPKILVINKIDKLKPEELDSIVSRYENMEIFDHIVPISALNGKYVNSLIGALEDVLPEGPQYFPDDMITDQPERLIIAELIREKTLRYLDQEIPHGIAVEVEQVRKREDSEIIDVSATIFCERDSHKGIVIGKGGRKLKGIGKSSRMEIERLLGSKVNLQLWVKVNKNWREKEKMVRRMGYK